MKPTSLLIQALALFASSAIGAPILEPSVSISPRAEDTAEGVVTWADVIKRNEDTAEGVVTWADVIKRNEDTAEGVVTWADIVNSEEWVYDGLPLAMDRGTYIWSWIRLNNHLIISIVWERNVKVV